MGEINKIVAGLCSTLLVLLGLNFFGELIFHPHESGDGEEHLAFALEIEDTGGDEDSGGPDLNALFAAADPAAGEKVFKKCQACHTTEAGENKTGPSLHGVVGRGVAAVADFGYSGALPASESWTPENLFHFLESPKGFAPGTSMGFAGLKKDDEIANLIAYLNQQSDAPIEIAATVEAAAPAETATDASPEAAPAADEGDASEGEAGAAEEAPAGDEAAAEEPAAEEAAEETATEEPAETEVAAAETTEDAPTAAASVDGADIAAGEKVFRKCKACHKLEEGANGVGPNLYAIVGRQIASVDGFNYSDALPADQTWTPENLMAFLEKPKDFAPGTKMSFAGLRKEEDRINIVGYLATIGQ